MLCRKRGGRGPIVSQILIKFTLSVTVLKIVSKFSLNFLSNLFNDRLKGIRFFNQWTTYLYCICNNYTMMFQNLYHLLTTFCIKLIISFGGLRKYLPQQFHRGWRPHEVIVLYLNRGNSQKIGILQVVELQKNKLFFLCVCFFFFRWKC